MIPEKYYNLWDWFQRYLLFFQGVEIQINSVRYAQHLSITLFIEEETGWKHRRLLRVSWKARWSNQSILKEISPEYSLIGLMLGSWRSNTLATKRPWCCEILKAGGRGDDRIWDGWMASLTQWTWVWANSRR